MAYLTAFHAIEERLRSGQGAQALLVAKAGPRAREVVDLAVSRRVRVDRTGTHELDRLAPGNRGVALLVTDFGGEEEGTEVSLGVFLDGLGERADALVVVLDEITDPHNWGAILRSCDQFGVDLVVSRSRRNAKNAATIAASSAGADGWVKTAEAANLPRALEDLKEAGFWVYGADMKGEAVWDKDLRGRVALVMGGEGKGLSSLLRQRCDGLAAIPTQGHIDSLNVSVAAGVLLYEVSRQRNAGAKARK